MAAKNKANSMKSQLPSKSKFLMWGENFGKVLENCVESQSTGKLSIHLYQILAVLEVRHKISTANDPQPSIIVAPTGSGKSGMIFMLPYVLSSNKVLILSPSSILTNQLAETFGSRPDNRNCFFNNMNISENHEDLSAFLEEVTTINSYRDSIEKQMTNVVIVSAQKFGGQEMGRLNMKYLNEETIPDVRNFFNQFDTIIVTESQYYPWKTWKQIEEFSRPNYGSAAKKIIFLTATPHMMLGNGDRVHVLGNPSRTAFTIDRNLCIGSSIRKLDFNMDHGNEKDFPQHIRYILDTQQNSEPRFIPQAIILTKSKSEVDRIVKELNKINGKGFAVGVSGTPKQIAKGLKDFTDGKFRAAVTFKVGLDGYDNTKVTLCVIMRKIMGKILFSQFVNRCMRIKRGLGQVNGVDMNDRSVGKVISYAGYEQEGMRRDYERLDQFIAGDDPSDEIDDEGE